MSEVIEGGGEKARSGDGDGDGDSGGEGGGGGCQGTTGNAQGTTTVQHVPSPAIILKTY